jgi:hypothetical protein
MEYVAKVWGGEGIFITLLEKLSFGRTSQGYSTYIYITIAAYENNSHLF